MSQRSQVHASRALRTMDSGMQSAMTSAQQVATAGDNGVVAAPNPPSGAVVATGDQAGPSMEVDRTKHPSGIVPVLQNLVATVNMGCALELKTIALSARNAEYNPKVRAGGWLCICIHTMHTLCIAQQRFAAVIMRIRDPKTTALIFASGKMVVTGAKSEEHSRLAARKVCSNVWLWLGWHFLV